MNKIIIDYEKCIGCLRCVQVCPFAALEVLDGKPALSENPDKFCIECMHCATVCPRNAVYFGDVPGVLTEELPKVPHNLPEIVRAHLMTRRSYRHFKPMPVKKELIEQAIELSAWAPSAKNQHPTEWIVVNDEDVIKEIMEHILTYVRATGGSPEILREYEEGNNVVTGTAKTLVFAYAGPTAINPSVDSAITLYTIELMLQAQGIGTCWAGYLNRLSNQIPEIKKLIRLPEGCQLYGALMAGYPEKEKYLHIPQRFKKPIVHWV